MKRLLLVPALGLAGLCVAAPAGAQFPAWGNSPRAWHRVERSLSYYDARRTAYDNGYREGLKEGRKDARRGEDFSYRDEKSFRRAGKGYHRTFGSRERYREAFRTGFVDGYANGYQRIARGRGSWAPYGRWGAAPRRGYPSRRPGVYRAPYPNGYPAGYGYSPAVENGRHDGYEKGMEDARKGRSFDPLRHKWYRSAERHYRRENGPKDWYRDEYRRGFQEGYDRGYGEAW